jgi:hypothetical protein
MRRTQSRGLLLRQAMVDTQSWFIQRVSSTSYKFIRSLGGSEFLSYDWNTSSGIPGPYTNLLQLGFARVGIPMLSVDDTEGTFDAAGWTHTINSTSTPTGYAFESVVGTIAGGLLTRFVATAGAGTFVPNDAGRYINIPGAGVAGATLQKLITTVAADGSYVNWVGNATAGVTDVTASMLPMYRWSNTAGKTAQWTSPAGATALGVRLQVNTSGGLFKVDVNGSATAANRLSSAQDLVTALAYPNTILVAHGGSLNPTDKVVDCYSGTTNTDYPLIIADGLTAGAHAVVLTATGYTHTGAINNRCQITGFSYSTGSETPSTTGAEVLGTFQWQTGVSAHEYAYRFVPSFLADGTTANPNAAGTPSTYYSRVHGYENQISMAMVIDGVATTMTDGQVIAVTTDAVLTQVSQVIHPDNTPVVSIDITTTYTLDAEGLTLEHVDTWGCPAIMHGGYPTMLPVAGAFDRYTASGYRRAITSSAGSGTRAAESGSWLSLSWTSGNLYATSTELAIGMDAYGGAYINPTIDPWWLEDRAPSSGIKINKQYGPWRASPSTPITIPAGRAWRLKTRYRYKRFPAGAEASLTFP